MKLQKLSARDIKKLPPQAVIIELRDENKSHLAYVACFHKQEFLRRGFGNDNEFSRFLEEISNFEAEILQNYFRNDRELEKRFVWTGEMVITGENSEIIYQQ